jgi:hypothetical protein
MKTYERPETPKPIPPTPREKRTATPEEVATLLAIVNALFPPEDTAQVREGTLRVLDSSPGVLHGTTYNWDADANGGVLAPQTFLPSPELDLRTGASKPVPSGAPVIAQRRLQNPLAGDVRWERLTISIGDVALAFARYEALEQSTLEAQRWQLDWSDLASATITRWAQLLSHVEWEDEGSLPVKFRRAVGRGSSRGYEPISVEMPADVAWRALLALSRAGLESVVLAALTAAAKEE